MKATNLSRVARCSRFLLRDNALPCKSHEAIVLQGWTSFYGSRSLKPPEFLNIRHMRVVRLFLFAFITFNPCFTAWVCHGVFTMCFLLLDYIEYVLSKLLLLSDLVLLYLIFLELILKLLEYGFKEACDSDGVYMVLKKQRRWDRFECRWAVGRQ
jgi:hypothetical protein